MRKRQQETLAGVILDRHATFTFSEVCRAAGAEDVFVRELVAEGVIDPISEASDWRFHGEALMRARSAHRLVRDLGINLPGVALVLDLMNEVERLRREVEIRRG